MPAVPKPNTKYACSYVIDGLTRRLRHRQHVALDRARVHRDVVGGGVVMFAHELMNSAEFPMSGS